MQCKAAKAKNAPIRLRSICSEAIARTQAIQNILCGKIMTANSEKQTSARALNSIMPEWLGDSFIWVFGRLPKWASAAQGCLCRQHMRSTSEHKPEAENIISFLRDLISKKTVQKAHPR